MDFQQMKCPRLSTRMGSFWSCRQYLWWKEALANHLVGSCSITQSHLPPWQQLKWQGLVWPVLGIIYSNSAKHGAEMDGSSANLHGLKCQLGLM